MNRKQNSQKDINEYKIVVPMSNEAVNKIKSNITKSILGVSIAGVMIAGGATQVKAETAENPTAIVHEVKDERKDEYDKALAAAVENILPQNAQALNSDKTEELALTSVNGDNEGEASADEVQADSNVDTSSDEVAPDEEKHDITLDEFINDDTLDKFFDFGAIEAEKSENIEIEEEKTPESQTAGEDQKATEPNYAEDEAKIKDYDEKERYRSTQMEQGNGPTDTSTAPDMDSKDGFSYNTLEPSGTSEDKKQWGVEMEFDKEKGQRTYTDFGFTNTGNYGRPSTLEPGNISANEAGDKLSEGFKDPNYKPDAEIVIDGKGQIKNLNLYATEEDLKHINSTGNGKTIMAWEGKYTKDNPNGLKATQGDSAAFTFTVNP